MTNHTSDYASPNVLRNAVRYEWIHTLGETITSLLKAGLTLKWLHEHDSVPFQRYQVFYKAATLQGTHRPSPKAMERKKASEFPQELLNIFDRYVHGEMSRRDFLEAAKKYAIGGLTATAIWEALRPNYAFAEQVAKDDKRLVTGYETVPSPKGNTNIRGYYVRPAAPGKKLPGILVIHENRGLNPYIEDVARRLGTENFIAFAPDGLTSVGGYPVT